MRKHFFISLVIAGILNGHAMAGTMGSIKPEKDWSLVGALSAGPVWARGGETQTFYLAPQIEKTYVARKSTDALASAELFIGLQKYFSSQWQGQLGWAVAATGSTRLNGIIWDDADPQFDNYSYHYIISHSHIAIKGKLLKDCGYWFIPWVSGSIGLGFNRAHNFINTPLIFEALPNANFANHTTTALTYTLGIGVQKSINDQWQVGIGYEFADWGKSKLERAAGQTMHSGLKLSHLYTNGVLFNLTYVS